MVKETNAQWVVSPCAVPPDQSAKSCLPGVSAREVAADGNLRHAETLALAVEGQKGSVVRSLAEPNRTRIHDVARDHLNRQCECGIGDAAGPIRGFDVFDYLLDIFFLEVSVDRDGSVVIVTCSDDTRDGKKRFESEHSVAIGSRFSGQ
jgi:hypothetical protein